MKDQLTGVFRAPLFLASNHGFLEDIEPYGFFEEWRLCPGFCWFNLLCSCVSFIAGHRLEFAYSRPKKGGDGFAPPLGQRNHTATFVGEIAERQSYPGW